MDTRSWIKERTHFTRLHTTDSAPSDSGRYCDPSLRATRPAVPACWVTAGAAAALRLQGWGQGCGGATALPSAG